jgi:L,D-transpeptidase YcbB
MSPFFTPSHPCNLRRRTASCLIVNYRLSLPHASLLLVISLILPACSQTTPDAALSAEEETGLTRDQLVHAIRSELLAETFPGHLEEDQKSHVRAWHSVEKLYRERDFYPIWIQNKPALRTYLASVCHATRHGLNPSNYSLGLLAEEYGRVQSTPGADSDEYASSVARLELLTTYSFLSYGSHLLSGFTEPLWDVNPENVNLYELLAEALGTGSLAQLLQRLSPSQPEYSRLQEALEEHRRMLRAGGWPVIPELSELGNDERRRVIAARLIASGDLHPLTRLENTVTHTSLAGQENSSRPSEESLDRAIRGFQKRHGLVADGIVGPRTIAEMNVAVEERIRQIELNLERWRWLPRHLGSRYLIVNVPDYSLTAYEGGKRVMKMAVVIGKEYTPTPVFSDAITYLEVNPYWNIPRSIATGEMLPKIQEDLSFLSRNRIEVLRGRQVVDPAEVDWGQMGRNNFPYRLRQEPGPNNSLGLIKFMFPNEYNVYLHDTPAGHLFERPDRAYSHGCIRVERPADLGGWILKDHPNWDQDRLEAAMGSGERRQVTLENPLPVYLLYWTAWVDPEGAVNFRRSVYDRDEELGEELPPQVLASDTALALCRTFSERLGIELEDFTRRPEDTPSFPEERR